MRNLIRYNPRGLSLYDDIDRVFRTFLHDEPGRSHSSPSVDIRETEKDLADVPKNVLEAMRVELVDHIDEVLKIALLPPETPDDEVAPEGTEEDIGPLPDGMTH